MPGSVATCLIFDWTKQILAMVAGGIASFDEHAMILTGPAHSAKQIMKEWHI